MITTAPVLWLDGSDVDGDGNADAGTGPVMTWVDKSPEGNDVSATVNQPASVADYNGTGLNAVAFFNQSLSRSGTLGLSGAPAVTVFVVATTTGLTGDGRFLMIGDDGASNGGRNISFSGDSSWRFNNGNNIFANDAMNGAGPSIGVWRSAADTNYGEKEFFLNGPTPAIDTDGVDTGGPTTIAGGGAGFVSVGSGWYAGSVYTTIDATANGDYAEILVYDVELIDEDLNAVGAYLQAKWNITNGSFVAPADSDGDGLADSLEQLIIDADPNDAVDGLDDVDGPDVVPGPPVTDFDRDGSTDADEFANGTNPINPDTDADGLMDGVETNTGEWVDAFSTGTNPLVDDSDGDGLVDGVENPDLPFVDADQTGTDPNEPQSDGDGLNDGFEVIAGLDPTVEDSDGDGTPDPEEDSDSDGLDNLGEQTAGSDPTDNDTDGDRLLDGAEVNTYGTDPTDIDSDGDTLEDGDEVEGANPFSFTSDPSLPDTDSDGVVDSFEVSEGTDPRDPSDFPAAAPDLGWGAEDHPDGDLNPWPPSINSTGNPLITFNRITGGVVQSGASNFANVNRWVNSPGYDLAGNPGDSWQDGLGNPATQENVSWEIVFRPGDYTGTHTLFNTGGNGDGTAFTLVGSNVEFRFQDDPGVAQQLILSADLSSLGPPTDFYHVVGIADIQSAATGTGTLYVNGALAAGPTTSAGPIIDWDGGDLAELGKGNNIPGGNPFNPAAFTGDIAAFNYFGGDLLNADIVESRFFDYSGGGELFQISEITYDPVNDQFSVTWPATEGVTYGLFFSTDLTNWDGDVDDAIEAEGDSVTFEFANPLPDPAQIFFRVERN